MVWLAVLLAVLGAFCLAFGAQRQGSAVKADTGGLALSTHGDRWARAGGPPLR